MGGRLETGGLFNLETMMVSVLHKRLEYKGEEPGGRAQAQEVLGQAAEEQNQNRTSSC